MSDPVVGPAIPVPSPRPFPTTSTARPSDGAAPSFASLVDRSRTPVAAPPPPSATLHAPAARAGEGSLGAMGRSLLARISHGERYVESVVRQGLGGRAFTNGELLAMQAQVYRYTQDLDLASKLVDKATSAVRTVLTQNG